MTQEPGLKTFSDQLADAAAAAGAWTVRVAARRGAPASGIALGGDLVLTAEHVVDTSREDRIRIGLPDGRELAGTVAGRDAATDLAVLRVAEAGLPQPNAAATEPRTGSLALLLARPGADVQASLGLVVGHGGPARTRRGGMLERFIGLDAVMYPGFSGGPLVDPTGAVLGMATSGLGFGGPSVAIPWDVAKQIADALAQHGRVPRGYLGVGSQPIPLSGPAKDLAGGQERGLLVVHVAEGGPAATAGILQGDILVKLDGSAIEGADELQGLLGPGKVGAVVPVVVVRGGELRELRLTVGRRESNG